MGEPELRAVDGRVPGRRGLATRQRLLDHAEAMLSVGSYRDVRVVDIARRAGTSPATFYQYFADVEAAVIALAEDVTIEGAATLPALVHAGDWSSGAAPGTARALVDGFLAFWEAHRAVLRVVELATAEGDGRFGSIRVKLLNELTKALADQVAEFRRAGSHPADVDAMAHAGVLVSMLAHVAAHRFGFEFWGIRTADLRTSMAGLVHAGVTGDKPG